MQSEFLFNFVKFSDSENTPDLSWNFQKFIKNRKSENIDQGTNSYYFFYEEFEFVLYFEFIQIFRKIDKNSDLSGFIQWVSVKFEPGSEAFILYTCMYHIKLPLKLLVCSRISKG